MRQNEGEKNPEIHMVGFLKNLFSIVVLNKYLVTYNK